MEDLQHMLQFGTIQWLFTVIGYIYIAICMMVLAGKFGRTDGWLAWIPFVNLWYMCILAEQSGWIVIPLLIPFINFIVAIWLWWLIAERAGKPGWVAILFVIPIVNIFIPGYIAFA